MKAFFSILAVIIAILAAVFIFFWSTSGPALTLTPDSGPVSTARPLALTLQAPRGGLRMLTVSVNQGDKKVTVLTKRYSGDTRTARENVDLQKAGLQDGPFNLQIETKASTQGYSGRSTSQSHSFIMDTKPPVVAVLTTAHNIIKGGAGLVTYTVSEDVERTGVVFGDRFVPGYRQQGELFVCLFPFPYNIDQNSYVPRVIAVDKAGNERLAGINFHLLVKPFSIDRINLTEPFLEKVAAEFKTKFPQAQTPLEIFLKANGELRAQNVKSLYEYGGQTSPKPLWQGTFLRMPNAAPLGGFAQTRIYLHNKQKVDQQDHLGFDLASVVHAPVPAANNGTIVFAGDLGIYGQCIIIDHGLGLQTLYGHLSRMAVKAGDNVEKGQIIGNTGATGMAAGDHLHFGVLVSGQEVSPVEWWDPSWIKNNITDKLNISSSGK
ncbi:M23 family metallopeptidase [Pelotalea chapellei]|uniref:M23 family metallopeptidase n=1 Tax=Pelotalea chapellei TaxID=44671 RepID=A0ABS5UB48_9BACT|nr:M23 family metallopeptidase [Pelotalea chapellei]MBT1072919.1 M23 family metallopeptidase [Pelotalea chapellei]